MAKAKPTTLKKSLPELPAPRGNKFDEAVEITEHEESAVEVSTTSYTNMPAFDSSDLFIPKLRIGQGLSAEVASGSAKMGDFLLTGSEPMKTCTIVPMLMTKRRELRTQEERAVVCRSHDSLTGVGTPGGECSTCPLNQWLPDKKKGGKNKAPACVFIYSYMVYIVEVEELAVLEFYRSSMSAGRLMNTIIMQKGLGNFLIKLSSQLSTGERGKFAMPAVAVVKTDPKAIAAAKKKIAEMGF